MAMVSFIKTNKEYFVALEKNSFCFLKLYNGSLVQPKGKWQFKVMQGRMCKLAATDLTKNTHFNFVRLVDLSPDICSVFIENLKRATDFEVGGGYTGNIQQELHVIALDILRSTGVMKATKCGELKNSVIMQIVSLSHFKFSSLCLSMY